MPAFGAFKVPDKAVEQSLRQRIAALEKSQRELVDHVIVLTKRVAALEGKKGA